MSVLQAAAGAAEGAVAGDADLGGVVTAAADAAVIALDKTTEQLDVLTDAGVVDAGGRGLLVLLDALSKTVSGRAPTRQEYLPAPPDIESTVAAPAPRFEVMYLLSGCAPDGVEKLRQRLDELGDSVAIAASMSDGAGRYSVHVHSDDAGGAIEAALPFGTPSRIQITSLTGGSGTHAPGGWPVSAPCWRSSTVTALPSCSPAKAHASCGPTPTRRLR